MEIIDDLIQSIDISEVDLLDRLDGVKRNFHITGTFPSGYSKEIYEIGAGDLNFTNSFLDYMVYNRHLLKFSFEPTENPTYLVYYMDEVKDISCGIPKISLVLKQHPGVVRTRFSPVQITLNLFTQLIIDNLKLDMMSNIYDVILSDLNQHMAYSYDQALYFYRMVAVKTGDTYRFVTRFGKSMKGIANITPHGKMPDYSKGPFKNLGPTK